jgi:hypothetical protein
MMIVIYDHHIFIVQAKGQNCLKFYGQKRFETSAHCWKKMKGRRVKPEKLKTTFFLQSSFSFPVFPFELHWKKVFALKRNRPL